MIHSFWLFDRHSECIYRREWNHSQPGSTGVPPHSQEQRVTETNDDIAKLIFGIVLSLRNLSRNLIGDDAFTSYTTSKYRLHYFESPSTLKLVMITDPSMPSVTPALQQIYATLYLEYVVKNPLSPVEHSGGVGVDNELFTMSLDAFVQSLPGFA